MGENHTSPQPHYELGPKGEITLEWRATGRTLKNRVVNPLEVQNPRFLTDGLYSVHAVIVLHTSESKIFLRSNEQQVPVGGSQEMPKHPLGTIVWPDPDAHTAKINLGSLHRIAVGDRFLIRTGMQDFWRLTIRVVEETQSTGDLAPTDSQGKDRAGANPKFPQRDTYARLIGE